MIATRSVGENRTVGKGETLIGEWKVEFAAGFGNRDEETLTNLRNWPFEVCGIQMGRKRVNKTKTS